MIYLAVICGLQVVIVLAMIYLHLQAQTAWDKERAALAQRIQAPQHAVVEHYNRESEQTAPPAVNEFDDEDYWASKEDLADRLAEREVTRD